MHAHRHAVLERETSVARDMVGVRVRLENANDAYAAAPRLIQIALDRVCRVDDDCLAGLLVADQVGRAAEVVVHELPKDHFRTTLPTHAASFLEVTGPAQKVYWGGGALLGGGLVAGIAALFAFGSHGGSAVQATGVRPGAAASTPPRGALVLAAEVGTRAVALTVERRTPPRLTATVLGPGGDPESGLAVSFRLSGSSVSARPCGAGCYRALAPSGTSLRRVDVSLPAGSAAFRIPAANRPGTAILRRATRVFDRLRRLVYVESLRSV